jgi:hypothetical protein
VFWLIALAVSLPFASKLSSILTGSEPFEVYASRMRLSHFASAAAKMSCVGYLAHPFVKRMILLLLSSFFSQL